MGLVFRGMLWRYRFTDFVKPLYCYCQNGEKTTKTLGVLMDKKNHPTFPYRPPSLLSLGQTDSQVVASSGKLNLRRDRQVSSQAHASRKCAQLKEDMSYISLANDRLMDVTQLALTWLGQTVKNLL